MAVAASASPLVERRRLRTELRQARQDAGLTQEAVAQQMDWSLSKIIRIEMGSVGISTNDLAALLRLYRVRDPQRVKELKELARASRQRTWWSKYRSILEPTYFQYIEYETSASTIRSYHTLVMPGLLQTEEYATAIISSYRTNPPPKTVQALVEVRMKRQELLLGRSRSPSLFFVIDEAVIHRLNGDEDLRKVQLEKLISMAERPGVTIEIVPFTAGIYRGMADNFAILEFSGPDDDVIYFESVRDQLFSREKTDEISLYRELYEDLRKVSLGPKGTLDYLGKVADAIH
jgi:transcriptional regulator with XRE-family HTH domain